MTAVGDGVDGTAQAMKIDEFVAVFRHHAAGVAVVTAAGPDGPVAMTVTSLFSVSAEPPMFAFSASSLSSASPPILAADTVVAHILHGDNLPIGRLGRRRPRIASPSRGVSCPRENPSTTASRRGFGARSFRSWRPDNPRWSSRVPWRAGWRVTTEHHSSTTHANGTPWVGTL